MKQNKIHILKNGLKIILYQDTSMHSTYAELIVNYGAINNKFILNEKEYRINDGMAHFIEHLLIEHSYFGNSGEYFRNNYVRSNGSTSFKRTRFYIKTVNSFLEHLEKLIKIVNVPVFTSEDIEVTKYPIYEEIRKSNDNHFVSLNELERKCMFKNIDFSTVLGSEEDIRKIDYNIVKMCYDVFYQPHNQILAIAGNFDVDEVIKFIEEVYNKINKQKINCVIPEYNELDIVTKKNGVIYKDVKDDYIRINYKINISSLSAYEKVKLTFYINYFLEYNFDESSDAYKKLIADKISVSSIDYGCNFIDDFMIISIGTYTNKFDEFVELIDNNMKNKNTNADDFEIRKKLVLISLILREENFMKIIGPFIDNVVTFDYYEIDKIEDIENQKYDDFVKTIESLNFENYCIAKMLKIKE